MMEVNRKIKIQNVGFKANDKIFDRIKNIL